MEIPSNLFVDTSFFIALLNKEDDDHAKALTLQNQLAAQTFRKYTSEYVLLELGDGLSRLRFRHLAIQLIDLVYSDATFEIVPASSDRFIKIHTLFKHRPDKEWGSDRLYLICHYARIWAGGCSDRRPSFSTSRI